MEHKEFIPLRTDLLQLITVNQAWHYSIVPKAKDNGIIEFFIDEQKNSSWIKEELEILFGNEVRLEKTPSEIINKTLGKYYLKSQSRQNGNNFSINGKSDDFIVSLIEEANSINCSDIHIESYEETCRVRMRIDGKLVERYLLKKQEYPSIINKIKIKANLDIAEKRLPQDGRIYFASNNNKFDIRVSILPGLYGEKAVLRLLSKDATQIDINELGFNKDQVTHYLEGIRKPHGIILISGPTGSGKTTTLYATLKILNREESNILTIEDPIEYTLDGINQVQLKESIGLTFAHALRTFLRQDPDIIMLGEIRDSETAQMAIRAALTGHLVASTIHTNSAWGTISRLIDMEVPPFLLATTINLTVAQRLVRLLCPSCKNEIPFDKKLYPPNFKAPIEVIRHFTAKGCDKCFYTGYKGRKAVFEVIPIKTELIEKIKSSQLDISSFLKKEKIMQLSDSAFEIFTQGKTSIEEVYPILMNSN